MNGFLLLTGIPKKSGQIVVVRPVFHALGAQLKIFISIAKATVYVSCLPNFPLTEHRFKSLRQFSQVVVIIAGGISDFVKHIVRAGIAVIDMWQHQV
jgi:hypothetical protein